MSYGKYVAMMHERGGSIPAASEAAREEAQQEKRRCEICGTLLLPGTPARFKVCGAACSYELNKRRNRERYRKNAKFGLEESRKCEWCGGEFTPSRQYQRFCGVQCQEARKRAAKRGEDISAGGMSPAMANRSYGIGECVICGEDSTKRSVRQHTCCTGCRKEYYARQRKEKKC